jgi:hypothetical protein
MTTLFEAETKRVKTELYASELRAWKPTPEQIRTAEIYFAALAWEKTVRPIVLNYQSEILAKHQWKNTGELARFQEMNRKHPNHPPIPLKEETITDPNQTYRLNEPDAQTYYMECDQQAKIHGLKHKPECCPLLEAESMTRNARDLMLDAMEPITHIKRADLWKSEHLDQLTTLACQLLAPAVRPAEVIANELYQPTTT